MKKLYMLILMLGIVIASQSQIPPYYNQIPAAGGNGFPFNANAAAGKKVQWIVGPGEFNQPTPVSAGNNITNLWFLANAAGNASYTTLTVRMATVPTSTYFAVGAFYAGSMTTVLSQNTTLAPTGVQTWVNIALTTPYAYDPTMNLIIEVSQCGYTGSGFSLNQNALGAAPNYRRQYSDASSVCGATVLATGGDLNVPGIGITVTPAVACVSPTAQPTALNLTAIGPSQINGSFTAAAGTPTNYLVVRYPAGASPTNPVDGTNYSVGASLGLGTVISISSSTSFSATGLTPSTGYDFYAYSYNAGACATAYRTTAPLFGTQATPACAGISGTIPVGPTGTYPTLTAAIAAASGGLSGSVIFELQSTYTSGGETYPITFPANGCINAGQTITVRPQTGATGLVITSSNATATVDFNGANYVTIDGRPGGVGVTSQLTITNTALGAAVGTRFINDASNNTITYCSLQGSTATSFGVVLFSTGITTGNDNNTISNNNIGSAGANLPLNGIYSLGTSAAVDNSGNTITANNIFDYFNATLATNGMNINSNNSAWIITNNRIYQTANRIYTTANTHTGINITSGSGYTITGNIIGYANNTATGTTNLIGNSVSLTGTFPSAYTVTGTANATRYTGINCAFTTGGTVSSIQNNTIAGFALYTSNSASTTTGIFCGIAVTSGPVNIGTATGNTIGATSGNGSIYTATTTSGGIVAGIYAASTNAIAIRNNTIGAIDAMGTSATISGGINGINTAGPSSSYDVSGNTIGNTTNPNLRMGNLTTGANLSNVGTTFGVATGTGQFNGILSSQTGTGTIGTLALPNIIRNASLNSSSTTASIRGITASGIPAISYNQINNITSQTTNIAVGSTLLAGMGIFMNSISSAGAIVTHNTINSLSLTNATATGTNITGIAVYCGTTEFSYNKIYDISNASTSVTAATPGTASAFFLRQPAGVQSIFNNMISLGNGQTTNTAFNGIWQQNSVVAYTLNCYFNSINIEGAGATGAQPSFCLNRGSYSATTVTIPVDIRNNIFTNTRSGGTGKHYAIGNCYGATAVNTGWGVNASNYNVLNANAATVGYWTTDQTFAGWKTASASDGVSQSGIAVNYANSSTGDLHLNMGLTPTSLESGGIAVGGITTDYDNQVRPGPAGSTNGGALAPDLGADEFDGVFLDLNPPNITYTLLPNTLCATNVSFTATITDASGVNGTVGTRPRVYYKKTTNANTFNNNTNATDGWKFAEATNAVSPFNLTLNLALINGGVAAGDVIQYFVVAQDLFATPNVGINSGTFAAPPSSVALTAAAFPLTGTINSYTITAGGLSGVVTIGAAGTYSSLTGAGGLFAAINASGLTGNVTVNILDASVTEAGTNGLNQMVYGCGGPYSLLIKPNTGVTSTLTGSFASGALIRILSNNVTIDGSNNGTTSRDLTITNTSVTAPTVIVIGSTGVTPVNTVTLKNSIIINGAQTATAVVVSDATVGTAGYFNNITIQNNSIRQAYIGIYSIAVPAAGNGSGLLMTGNDLNTAGATSIRLVGLYVQGVDGATLSNNNIGNIANTLDASNISGIWLATSTVNTTLSGNNISTLSGTAGSPRGIAVSPGVNNANINLTGNTISGLTSSSTATTTGVYVFAATSGVTIQKNNINNIKNTNGTGFGCNGIQLESTLTAADVNVHNNYISDIAGFGFNGTGVGDNGYGIIITTGGGYNLYYNTVVMNTNQTAATGLPAALNITSGITTANSLNVRNNIFVNTQTIGTNRYCVFSGAASSVYTDINYNDYYFTGPNLGNIGGTTRVNLAAWQAGTTKDAQSKSVQPIFVSATDFHLSNAAGANWCLNGTGQTIATYTTDYDGNTRGTPPDMGADEFIAVGTGDIATPASQTVCSATPITTIVLSGGATSYSWTRDNTVAATGIAASGTGNISGTLTNTTASPVTVTFTITALDVNGCVAPATFTATVTVNPTNTITLTSAPGTNAQTVCINTPITNITYTTTTATGATFSGLPAGVSGVWAANVVTISGTPTAAGTFNYTVTLTGGGSCGTLTASGSITVTANNTITLTSAPGTNAQSVCLNSPIANITYSTTGATGATFAGLPAGVTGVWAVNVVTISGTPTTTVGSPFNYTVTLTGGCGAITATGSITVRPLPVISSTQVEPTTCASADGSIDITVTGAAGPYTFAWTGSGVIPGNEDQINLTVGSYSVTVTAGNGCTATASFALSGPGGCSICPTIPNFTTTPSGAACAGTNVTFTASGLTNMGTTYGIIFKYSTVILANPYVGGTVIATVLNGALTGGKTIATANSASIPVGSYNVYAILTPTPVDPLCRPVAQVSLTIGATPDVNQPANQVVCNNTATAAVNFTGSVPGTTFSWTNSTTSIGLAASGTGDIASFTATNASNAAVVATVTVTPSIASPVSTSITMPAQNSTFSPNVRGYWFTAPVNFTITSLFVPTDASAGSQSIAVVRFNGNTPPPVFAATTNAFSTLFLTQNDVTAGNIAVNIPILAGEVIGILGSRAGVNSYGDGSAGIIIAGSPVATTRMGMQFPLATTTPQSIWQEPTNSSISRVLFQYSTAAITCQGTPKTFTITVNPTPIVNPVTSQTVCNGTQTAAVNFTSPTGPAGAVTFNWTNSNTAIGLGASGSGNIPAFTGTNATAAAISGTITVTPVYTGGSVSCTGTPITFTITVNPTPTVNAQANQTVCSGAVTTATFTGAVAGTVYNWTNTNTAIGLGASGTGNISFTATNAGAAPITGTITVSPSYTNGGTTCTGTPTTFTITVNPTPTVNAIPNQVLCQNQPTAPVNFTGTPAGVVFQWTNNNTLIGLAAAGTGNIPSFIAQNPTNVQQVATITVTPVTGLSAPVVTTFNFTGAVQTYTVPAGVTSINLKSWGAQGNNNAGGIVGGLGGYAEGNLAVTAGQILNVNVGGGAATSITGGFNGGGNAGVNAGCAAAQGGGGGGASDVRIAPYALGNRVIVGAGGGGAGGNRTAGCGRGSGGGGGGGLWGGGGGAGWPGIPGSEGPVPTGGTQTAGGAGGVTTFTPGPTSGFPGTLGVGGAGGTEIASAQGVPTGPAEKGGIGGGLTGGSGLYNNANNWNGQSGAGGSSYIGGVTGGLTTAGLRTGAGQVQITYTPVSATTCFGTPRTFTITVNPNANLVIVADPGTTICEGDPTLLTVYDAAGSGPVSLTQSSSQVPVAGSVSCNAGGLHTDNSYWRAYNLAPLGLPSALTVNTVTFGIEQASGGAQPVTVNLYTQTTGTFPGGTRTLVGTQAATVNNATLTTQTVTFTTPAVVPNTAVLIVELFTPSGQATNRSFFIGSNTAPQTAPSYISATACGIANPTDLASIGFPNMHIILNVGGSVSATGPQSTGTFLWSPAAGLSSTTSNPVAASPMNTTTYTVTRTTVPGGCVASAQITITVNKRPTVTTQPVATAVCSGSTATFTVGATGTGLTYQWQVSTAGCAGPWTNLSNAAPYSGVNTATLTINPVTGLMNGYGYRVIVSGACAPVNGANISNCALLTVNPLPVVVITPAGPVCGGVAGLFGTQLSVGSTPPPVPGSVTVSSAALTLGVPDNTANGVSNNIAVAGVPANATITNVRVALNMPHTYPADMTFNLKAPNGQILNLYKHNTNTDNGAASIPTAGFYNAVVSGTAVTQFVAVPTPFRYGQTAPAGPYKADALNGVTNPGYTIMDPTGFVSNAANFAALYTTPASTTGNWTLAMCDGGPGDVGTLTSWSITIDYTTPGTGNSTLSYVWSPLTGLYTDPTAITAYTGTNLATVYAAPTVQTLYTVTATNTLTNCVSTASVLVNYTPPAPTVTPSSVTMCLGDPAVKLKASSSTTSTVAFNSGTIAVAIPDNNQAGASHTIAVSGIPANATVTGMRVKMTIPHTFIGDLVIALRAPNNNVLNLDFFLSNTFGGATTGFSNTIFTSAAGAPAVSTGTNPYSSSFRPDGQIAATGNGPAAPTGYTANMANYGALINSLTSANVNGNYTLAMYDGGAIDIGTLTNWEIEFTYVQGVVASPAVWSPAAGLFSDAAAQNPYVAGTRVDSVWTRPTPSGVYTYQVTVNNVISSGGPISLPPQASTFTGNVRGYFFTAPSSFTMTSVQVPTDASAGAQNIAVVRFTGALPPPAFPGTTNAFTTLFLTQNNTAPGAIPVNIQVNAGDVIGILGDRGADVNSYSGLPPNTTVINGTTVNLTRMGMQFPLATTAPQQIWQEAAGAISRVFFSTAISGVGTCTSPPRTVIVTVNQPATITTQPVSQTICTDKVATFTVVPAGTGPFTYQWQVSTDNGNTYTNITNGGVYSGANTATLTITAPPVSMNGYLYRVIISGAAPCASATSNAVKLTVNPLPVVTIAPVYSALFPGLTATLTSTVTPNAAASYTWIRDGVVLTTNSAGVLSGIGTGTLVVNVDGMGTYTLRVNDVNGCTNTSNSALVKDSASAKCFIYPNPSPGKFQVRYYSVANNTNLPRGIVVYDAKGDRVFLQNYSVGRPYDRMDVDMRAYGKGLYWVEIVDRNGNRLTMCRVVIQ